jgi:hypothetical protein
MKAKMLTLLFLVVFNGSVLAGRSLERGEILQIFEALTTHPQKGWISSGTIQARHEEYQAPAISNEDIIVERIEREIQEYLSETEKAESSAQLQQMMTEAIPFNVRYRLSNEYTMISKVILKYDGDQFFWQIDVLERADSLQPPAELKGNGCLEHFNLYWNQKRVFAWDQEKYITYFRPGNHATITDTPSGVNGPLTAGFIPWGYGEYSFTALSQKESSALEQDLDGYTEIHLTMNDDLKEETFILDHGKNYALKHYSKISADGEVIIHSYGNYQQVGDAWCPGVIVIEKYDTTSTPSRLLHRDTWHLDSISTTRLEAEDFAVEFEYDALIEDFRFGEEGIQYRYSAPESPSAKKINTEQLLASKLEFQNQPIQSYLNCAMAAIQYITKQLSSEITGEQAAKTLLRSGEEAVTLHSLQEFFRQMGLHCQAVKTNIETVKQSNQYLCIAYLPQERHFVVLGDIDERFVRIIDLSRDQFYYRRKIEDFQTIWDGTALLVYSEPLVLQGSFSHIDSAQTQKIIGAGECETCTDLIQQSTESGCNYSSGMCSTHKVYFKRYGCESASYGSCYESTMPKYKTEPCIVGAPNPGTCIGTGLWTEGGEISACK